MMPKNKPVCFVCGMPIRGDNAVWIDKDRARHPTKCMPGSDAYMENKKLARIHRKIMNGGTKRCQKRS